MLADATTWTSIIAPIYRACAPHDKTHLNRLMVDQLVQGAVTRQGPEP